MSTLLGRAVLGPLQIQGCSKGLVFPDQPKENVPILRPARRSADLPADAWNEPRDLIGRPPCQRVGNSQARRHVSVGTGTRGPPQRSAKLQSTRILTTNLRKRNHVPRIG